MELAAGHVTDTDREAVLDRLDSIGAAHGSTVQAFDARYVVGRTHLERAVSFADRARDRGEAIADDRAMEILCYAAGTRQIEDALDIGVSPTEAPVVILIDGGDETAAATAVQAVVDPAPVLGDYDRERVRSFYDIGDAELAATDAGLAALVHERVALLVVER